MKINTLTALKSLKDEVLKDDNNNPITLGQVVSNSLSFCRDSKDPSKAYMLAKKFATEEEVELSSEDIVFIKSIIQNTQLPVLSAGQVIALLES